MNAIKCLHSTHNAKEQITERVQSNVRSSESEQSLRRKRQLLHVAAYAAHLAVLLSYGYAGMRYDSQIKQFSSLNFITNLTVISSAVQSLEAFTQTQRITGSKKFNAGAEADPFFFLKLSIASLLAQINVTPILQISVNFLLQRSSGLICETVFVKSAHRFFHGNNIPHTNSIKAIDKKAKDRTTISFSHTLLRQATCFVIGYTSNKCSPASTVIISIGLMLTCLHLSAAAQIDWLEETKAKLDAHEVKLDIVDLPNRNMYQH